MSADQFLGLVREARSGRLAEEVSALAAGDGQVRDAAGD
jgi:hypothetical protein